MKPAARQIHITFDPNDLRQVQVSVLDDGGTAWETLDEIPNGPLRVAIRSALIQATGMAMGVPAGQSSVAVIISSTGGANAYYGRVISGLEALGAATILHQTAQAIEDKTLADMAPAPSPSEPEPGTAQ